MKKPLLNLAGITAFLILAAASAAACVCPPVNPNQTAEQARAVFLKEAGGATAIFSGEVVESSLVEAKFKVDKVWKGEVGEEVTVLTGVVMHVGGGYSVSSCDYGGYRVGRKYVVWAGGPADALKAHACSRTRFAEGAGQDIELLDDLKASGNEHPRDRPQPKAEPPGQDGI